MKIKIYHVLLLAALLLAGFSQTGPIVTPDLPGSVLRAFKTAHPEGIITEVQFDADDAGILYQVSFREQGHTFESEIRYQDSDWLDDVRMDIAADSSNEDEGVMPLQRSALTTHKR